MQFRIAILVMQKADLRKISRQDTGIKQSKKTAEVVFESGVIEAKKQSDFDQAKIMIQEALDKEPNMPLAQKEVLVSIINLQ